MGWIEAMLAFMVAHGSNFRRRELSFYGFMSHYSCLNKNEQVRGKPDLCVAA